VIKYLLARLVLFVLAVTLLGVLGAGPGIALIGGLLISALLAYVLLGRLRDASTIVIVDRVQSRAARRRAARVDEDELYEDAQVNADTASVDRAAAETIHAERVEAGTDHPETAHAKTADATTADAETAASAAHAAQEPAHRPGL
jgi:hypothetical protein